MSRWLALLAVLVAACSQSSGAPVAHQVASPSAGQITTQSPSSLTTSPTQTAPATAIPALSLTTVAFSCRLPIYKQDANTVDSFISFPSADLTVSPSADDGKYYPR